MAESNVGARLVEERKRLSLNQAELGNLGGVGKTTQLNYEKGNSHPDAPYLNAIAAAGVDVLYVITGQRTPHTEEALSVREQTVLYNYRALSEEDRAAVQRLTHALAQSTDDNHEDGKQNAG
ncbi:MAG: helix-turn-helix transcriptional regulator [Pseudohongiella sp.]|nr:helix-turn-helix transcriptional regulator [Pseudohongiella sp.]